MAAVCFCVDLIHGLSPVSISSSSMFVEITVSGVFSSWEALVINCFCCSMLRMVGSTAFREASITSTRASRMPPAQATAEISTSVRTVARRVSQFSITTWVLPSFRVRVRNR